MRKEHHIVPSPQGGWDIRKNGSSRASNHCNTKQEAIDRGREISKNANSELVIHNKKG